MISPSSYLEGDLYGQSDGLRMVLYAANQAGHKSLRFGSVHKEVDVKAFIFLYIQKQAAMEKSPVKGCYTVVEHVKCMFQCATDLFYH